MNNPDSETLREFERDGTGEELMEERIVETIFAKLASTAGSARWGASSESGVPTVVVLCFC